MDHNQVATSGYARLGLFSIEEATPAPRPSAMPTQIIEIWTPRLLYGALLRASKRRMQSAALSVASSDERQ
jgi:hypothetical protein